MAVDVADDLDRLRKERPDVVTEFRRLQPRYDKLCREVEYILKKAVQVTDIKVAAISRRAKSLKSIAEKIFRKGYQDPLNEVTDVAGVRVVFLYLSDRQKIEKLVSRHFQVIEWIDKVEERSPSEFGYGAIHCLVKLSKKSSGARHDDVKHLACEIQIRTVLQDAWATIGRHLSYKQDVDVPSHLLRKLNALAGAFSTADDQFDTIRAEREKYVRQVRKRRAQREAFLRQEIDFDTLLEYVKWKFSAKKTLPHEAFVRQVLRGAQVAGLRTLSDIEEVIRRTRVARAAIGRENRAQNGATEVNRAIALVYPAHRKTFGGEARERLQRHAHLVEE